MAGLLSLRHTIRCLIYLVVGLISCSDESKKEPRKDLPVTGTGGINSGGLTGPQAVNDTVYLKHDSPATLTQKPGVAVATEEVMSFAESLVGIPYKYASSDPAVGFDCSGFITYVFTRFGITVPRTSIGFTDLGVAITEENVTRGDVILFTGTNPDETLVGHMGLITSHDDTGIHFIHSTSGKANAVTVTELNDYYRARLVGFRRIL